MTPPTITSVMSKIISLVFSYKDSFDIKVDMPLKRRIPNSSTYHYASILITENLFCKNDYMIFEKLLLAQRICVGANIL